MEPEVVLCRWCKVRPARVAEIKWGHYRCSQCRIERHREGRKKWRRAYESKCRQRRAQWFRDYRKRAVRIGHRSISFPTVEMKEQAAELIRRRRAEWRSRVTHVQSKS